jgi:hypothetical protein
MRFQVNSYAKSYIEREMENSATTRLPLHSIGIIYPSLSLRIALHFGIILTHIYLYHWGESKRALKTLFLAINAKGGESVSPKQKHRTTTPISKKFETKLFSIGIFEISIPLRNSISIGIYKEEFFKNLVSKIFDLFQLVKPS